VLSADRRKKRAGYSKAEKSSFTERKSLTRILLLTLVWEEGMRRSVA